MTGLAQQAVDEVDVAEVEIPAGAVRLAGVLRVPRSPTGLQPGIVLTGPFTGVKEQVVGTYAAALAAAGFVTLAFDHRNFGASGGEPRQHEDSAGKLADLRHATSYLAGHDRVDADRLGCVGVCLGGGYALRHSAFDPRIRVLAVVAAAFNDPRAMREGMGTDGYRAAMAGFAQLDQQQFVTGQVDYLPAVTGEPGHEAAMAGAEPFAYYGTERSASPSWVNQVTRLSIRELLTFDAAMGAEFLGPTPALVVHGRRDEFCSPAAAERVYERITGPKELMWLDTTNHIDLYDVPAYVDPAIARVAAWMSEHLR
ncbi:MAG: alpha/beta hydrolase [Pseudonocardia sp.]|nr:alpha/beta hydrolase [Pseudonocardia sp.]